MIKEQNMLDVFDMVEGYCLLAIERMNLIQQEKLVFLIYLCFFMKILVAQLVDYLVLNILVICL